MDCGMEQGAGKEASEMVQETVSRVTGSKEE